MESRYLECVDLCEDIYKEKSLGKTIEDPRFHSKCGILNKDSYTTITFRGTASINNWINNLYVNALITYRLSDYFQTIKFLPRHNLEGHQGFFTMADRLYEKIKLGDINKNTPLRIYGHSLGGALATIVAYCLSYEGYTVEVLITIGCPRVFQVGTIVTPESSFNEIVPESYRLMNEEDIVTFLPLNTKDKTFINYDFEKQPDMIGDPSSLWRIAVAGASSSIGTTWVWDTIIDKIFHNVKNFRHVGKGIILSPRTLKKIGLTDIGRNVDDITVDVYYKYLSLIFSSQTINGISTTLGIGLGTGNFATIIEDLTSNQWILNFVRTFTFNWKTIGYEMTNSLYEQDPFYKKLIRFTGNDPEIKSYLPLLDFERGRRRFFGKILPDYYKTVNGFIYTKLQSYKSFSDSTEKIKFFIVDEIMEDWIKDDTIIIGKSKKQAVEFYKLIRRTLLAKFVGNSKTQSGGLRDRLGFTGTNFKEQQTRTIIFASVLSLLYFLVYSVIMYRMTYKGAYDHQITIYRRNILAHFNPTKPDSEERKEHSPPPILSFCYIDESEMGNIIVI